MAVLPPGPPGDLLHELEALLVAEASSLRDQGEIATVSVVDEDGDEPLLALEVSRLGGDWQRNLVVTFEPDRAGARVVAEVTDDEGRSVAVAGDVSASCSDLGPTAHRLTRAALDLLHRELV